jgi:hypothetical protein
MMVFFMRRILLSTIGLVMIAGCAMQRPVLYPNDQLRRVGASMAEREIDECMLRAENYVASDSASAKAAENVATDAGTSAAIGAAGGAAGGSIWGRAGTGAAAGAAGGAAAGATRGLIHGMVRKQSPSAVYKNFVNRCLREKGYDPIGWN